MAKIAVIGAGVAGVSASHFLSKTHDVTLIESENRIGGHTHTVPVNDPLAPHGIDTGFIVLNDRTYPNLHRFLQELGVKARFSDMSFGFHDLKTGLCYSGRGVKGLLARKGNLFSPRFWNMTRDFIRFNEIARRDAQNLAALRDLTLAQYVQKIGMSQAFVEDYLVPMGGAIWSTGPDDMMEFPAETLVGFFLNHGLLQLKDRPKWQTVEGGSKAYMEAFAKQFPGTIQIGAKIDKVVRNEQGVMIRFVDGSTQNFDKVIFAVHGDQVLDLLEEPTIDETLAFRAWKYLPNRTVLHTDESVLPKAQYAQASWNFIREHSAKGESVAVTYDMNRLMGIQGPTRYLVSLNLEKPIPPEKILREFLYFHPNFTREALASRALVPALQGSKHTYFTGSYLGYGFHEDAIKASVQLVSKHFGVAHDYPSAQR